MFLPAVAAGIAIAVAAGLATILVTSEAGAGASELTFDPPAPQLGESVKVTYRPGTALAGADYLRLRVRNRTGDAAGLRGTMGTYREIELVPTADGKYTGTLHRLDATVYEQFSVEDLAGVRLDDRNGRLWELASPGWPRPSSCRMPATR